LKRTVHESLDHLSTDKSGASPQGSSPDCPADRVPPRARILTAAGELFYRHGIRAVGVEAIAEAASTNKMTLYRHFASKDELVAEYLRQFATASDACWDRLATAYPGDALAQLCAWLEEMAGHVAGPGERGCALANAAIELPEKDHPARRVIEEHKRAQRMRLAQLAEKAGLSEPEMLAEELHLLLEGARVTAQSIGADGLAERLLHMGKAMIAGHTPRR
jgi:AcrR family transcriptional regulator